MSISSFIIVRTGHCLWPDCLLLLRKSDGTLSSHYPLSSIVSPVEPQDYVLLTKSMGGVSDFYLISSPDALHELNFRSWQIPPLR